MSDNKPPMTVCSDPECGNVADIKWSDTARYCKKHYRFRSMRHVAKKHGKEVPTIDDLESYLASLKNFTCPLCLRKMAWSAKRGQSMSSVISLQHWMDGSMGLICFGCNSAQQRKTNPNSREVINSDSKQCSRCLNIKLKSDFGKHSRKRDGVRSRCKQCEKDAMQELAKEIMEGKA